MCILFDPGPSWGSIYFEVLNCVFLIFLLSIKLDFSLMQMSVLENGISWHESHFIEAWQLGSFLHLSADVTRVLRL